MREWLDKEMARGKETGHVRVLGYTFATFPLTAHDLVYATKISNLADFPETTVVRGAGGKGKRSRTAP